MTKDDVLERFRLSKGVPSSDAPIATATVPLSYLDAASNRIQEAALLLCEAREWKRKGYFVMRQRIDEWAARNASQANPSGDAK